MIFIMLLIFIVDLGAITNMQQGVESSYNVELAFLALSGIFFVFAGVMLFKKRKPDMLLEPKDSEKNDGDPDQDEAKEFRGRF